MENKTNLLKGKRGLVMGVANNRSIAWGIAKACCEHGAEIALSYQGEAIRKRVIPLSEELNSALVIECDVTNTKSIDEMFYGASIFLEGTSDEGVTVGIDYVPLALELGSGSRTDTAGATAGGGAENDTGTRKASAELEDFTTIYTNIPMYIWRIQAAVPMETENNEETSEKPEEKKDKNEQKHN